MQNKTVRSLISDAISVLNQVSDSSRLDAEVLLCHSLNWSRTKLFLEQDQLLSDNQLERFSQLIARRKHGEPIAYITGEQEFWSLPLAVNSATLIPRPETEHLVEQALLKIPVREKQHLLDLGTGSGAIAIAIASERPLCDCVAVDASEAALIVAKKNAEHLGYINIRFYWSDWFANLAAEKFNVIVSNPPYIEENDPHLLQGDVVFEPRSALTSGTDGLSDIRLICQQANNYLYANGWLMLEHGWNQAEAVRKILIENGFLDVHSVKDLAGIERISLGRFKNRENNNEFDQTTT